MASTRCKKQAKSTAPMLSETALTLWGFKHLSIWDIRLKKSILSLQTAATTLHLTKTCPLMLQKLSICRQPTSQIRADKKSKIQIMHTWLRQTVQRTIKSARAIICSSKARFAKTITIAQPTMRIRRGLIARIIMTALTIM